MFGIKRAAKYLLRKYNGFLVDSREIKAKAEHMLSEQGSGLDRTGFIEGTDKAAIQRIPDYLRVSHDYLRHYDYLFSQFRGEKFSLIEFGCAGGASLRTWEQYFPHAEIYGVDLNENARQHEKGRVHIVIGDATSEETFSTLKAQTGGAFIILDDASHAWSDQRRSFELFWDMVRPGGFYVIEDLECGALGAYPAYPPKVLDSQPFSEYIHDRSKILRWAPDRQPEENSYHFDHLPEHIQKIERALDMCIFIPGAVVLRKRA
ncbi:MAG: class I SAM-dependent methyltransferase [Synergistaceae bacterium]|nr:class I SAM-dependent methyltransferase [Synergistaceae bacterium]